MLDTFILFKVALAAVTHRQSVCLLGPGLVSPGVPLCLPAPQPGWKPQKPLSCCSAHVRTPLSCRITSLAVEQPPVGQGQVQVQPSLSWGLSSSASLRLRFPDPEQPWKREALTRGSERRLAGTRQGPLLVSKLTTSQARGAGPGHLGWGRAATRSGATSVDSVSRPGDVEPGPSPQPRPLGACLHTV